MADFVHRQLSTIAGALRNIDYDLIITGRQAIDGDTAQV